MTLSIGATAPDFEADTTKGRIRFHEWLGDSWGVLFSHPKDFTPVCTTELGYLAGMEPQFKERGAKIIGLSIDTVDDHNRWMGDIGKATGHTPEYPMIADHDLKVAKLYEMLPADSGESSQGRTAAHNATVRTVYIIGPDKQIKATIAYPMSSGRNFEEILRLLDSCQLTSRHKIATPVNWNPGEDCIISPAVSDEDAKGMFPGGFETKLPYLRTVKQPA